MARPQDELEQARLENSKNLDLQDTQIREFRVAQRLRMLWLIASLLVALLLGWATLVGLWQNYPAPFSIIGLIAGVLSTAFAAHEILARRPGLAQLRYNLLLLQNEELQLAAASAADPVTALRIYRVSSQNDVEEYRRDARKNRRVHNIFQGTIIIGSIVVTSLTSAGLENLVPVGRRSHGSAGQCRRRIHRLFQI
jgi:hypothetical protein